MNQPYEEPIAPMNINNFNDDYNTSIMAPEELDELELNEEEYANINEIVKRSINDE